MKKTILVVTTMLLALNFTSCKKCANCHYDKDGAEIELGETCGKDNIEDMEAGGKTIDGVKYDVHCSDH